LIKGYGEAFKNFFFTIDKNAVFDRKTKDTMTKTESTVAASMAFLLIFLFILIASSIKGCSIIAEEIKKEGLKGVAKEIWEPQK